MEDKYRIFEEEKFNKILDLITRVDNELAGKFKKVVSSLPKKLSNALGEGEDFSVFHKSYDADLLRIEDGAKDSLFFTYKNYDKKLKIEMSVFPFSELDLDSDEVNFDYEEDNIPQEDEEIEVDQPWFVFSLTFTVDDKKGFDWEVYVQPYEDEYQVISIKNYNGEMINQKIEMLSYDEIIEFADDAEYDEEEFEEDEDIEFDGIAEYDEETGEVKVTALFEDSDFENIKIDEESGEPEIEVELDIELPSEEDPFDDKTDYYTP